ncbi:MAG: VIT domain-containing protein, partial [Planctomycetota bacterium]|nr:VIT domain-containing protein [Planctomycetota bacterium]
MTCTPTRLTWILFAAAAVGLWTLPAWAVETEPIPPDALARNMEAVAKDVTQGALRVVKPGGEVVECPLKHTDVTADISGFIARVKVTQVFYNPLDEKIEAVYVFPLPHKAAVDDMTMVIGDRRIVGLIKRRAEARQIYETAIAQGATAALLEQERPNIFTQTVGNIAPRQEVRIEISYVDVLEYDMGTYEFHFPMVVGPRYIPGSPTSGIPPVPPELKGKVGELDKSKVREGPDKPKGDGWSPDTNRVPDASRITPPVLKPGYRNGHDITLSVTLDAGVPVQDLKVTSHEATIQRTGKSQAAVKLSPADSIPNKAFVLRYGVVGQMPEMAMLSHAGPNNRGYFMLMVQPADDERVRQAPPREIVFLVDVSGSMSGPPTAKVIDAMQKFLKLCKPADTVQVITFDSNTQKLFEKPVPVSDENIKRALNFTQGLKGGGGTEMLKGIRMVLEEPPDPERVRIVIMLTDGYIGNEAEIIAEVGRRAGDRIRFWCVGIGSDPNRFLLDGVARQGGGMSKTLGLKDDPTELVGDVMFRIHRAQLANVQIEWGGLAVSETYPAKIPELWAGRPIVLFGSYDRGGEATIRITGNIEGKPASGPLPVMLPASEPRNEVLAKVWARNKIEDLMQPSFY